MWESTSCWSKKTVTAEITDTGKLTANIEEIGRRQAFRKSSPASI